jgi:thioredoxin reductase
LDPLTVLGALALLVGLFVLLGLWETRIEEARRERVEADLREARTRGTDRPVAQHPQIDVEACIGCGSCVAACPEDGVLALVDGVARVVQGSRCVGHGRCAEVCPVAAVKVGLGDLALRADIPLVSSRLESSVPGVFIAGELGGFSLIRNAVAQGRHALVEIARELRSSRPAPLRRGLVDVLIVGAGPAGLAASLKAVESRLSYVTIDQDDVGGTVRKYPRRKLTLTGPLELPLYGRFEKTEYVKEDLIRIWEEIRERFHLRISAGVRLLGVDGERDAFVARTSAGPIAARRILLALGRRGTPRRLGVPGEDTEKVLYQLVDTATYRNERLLVVGGGDSAVEAATGLADQPGNLVTLSYRRSELFRLKARNEARVRQYAEEGKLRIILGSELERVEPHTVFLSVEDEGVRRTLELANDQVFIFAGGEPPYALLERVGVRFGGEEDGGDRVTPEREACEASR